jgi:uncharacterized membrane protein SpoIIM required for sporulation
LRTFHILLFIVVVLSIRVVVVVVVSSGQVEKLLESVIHRLRQATEKTQQFLLILFLVRNLVILVILILALFVLCVLVFGRRLGGCGWRWRAPPHLK